MNNSSLNGVRINCPICENDSKFTNYLKCRDRLHLNSPEEFQLVTCSICDFVFLNPQPPQEKIELSYNSDSYNPHMSVQNKNSLFNYAYTFARFFTLKWKKDLIIKIMGQGGRILDGGCGTGELLLSLKEIYEVHGFEQNQAAAEWSRESYQIDVQHGNLNQVSFENEYFDLITLWHVLEHLPNLKRDLEILGKKLKKNGRLLIAVPNLGSLDAAIYRENWAPLDAPRHLWHFRKTHLLRLCENSGFEFQSNGMLPLDTFYNVLLSEKQLFDSVNKLKIVFSLLRVPASILTSLVYGLFTSNHSSLYYVFRKK